MKDLVITSRRLKKEWRILIGCFVAAFLTNVAAVIIYKTAWHEVFSQIGYVVVITVVLYAITILLRFVCWCVASLFGKRKSVS